MGSVHNELTGRAGFISRAIRNALQIDDGGIGIERLSETLTPTINLWERPEWALLRGERIWGVAPSAPAVAGQFSQVGISNPNNSGLIVVVQGIGGMNMTGVPEIIEVMLGANVAFTSTSTPNSRDSRVALLTGVQCTSFVNQAAARIGSGALIAQLAINGGTYSEYHFPIVLSPGFFVAAGPSTVNRLAALTFFGYERPAFAGELTARA